MENDDAPIDTLGKTVVTISNLVASAGDTEEARQAASNLGKAAVTLTETVNTLLLPLAAVNFAVDKARRYFKERFEQDLLEASKNIPEEALQEPKAYLAAPVLQGLAFAHEEDELKRLYLALLASSMDARAQGVCHPAFADIIKQLTPEESRALQQLLPVEFSLPIVGVARKLADGSRILLARHILSFTDDDAKTEMPNPSGPAIVVNLVRLGLFEFTYDRQISAPGVYDWAKNRPEYLEALKLLNRPGF